MPFVIRLVRKKKTCSIVVSFIVIINSKKSRPFFKPLHFNTVILLYRPTCSDMIPHMAVILVRSATMAPTS